MTPVPHESETILDGLWLIFRLGIKKHIEAEALRPQRPETENQYRERAEKAGLAFLMRSLSKADQP